MRNVRDGGRVWGRGIRERKMAEGRWVKTIVCFPLLVLSEFVGGDEGYLDVANTFGDGGCD